MKNKPKRYKRNEELLKARKNRKLSQQKVADELEITRHYYSQIERGERRPSLELALKISDFFAISPRGFV
ncbi:helix-turn-helix transcriptional regulator [Priestia aryabhattai]|uniref:helix-turn-helix transcriptional regulator n=1 Tax=Priestia aryabhattai TaxID=412384 RepID=UPI003C98A6A2